MESLIQALGPEYDVNYIQIICVPQIIIIFTTHTTKRRFLSLGCDASCEWMCVLLVSYTILKINFKKS